MFFIEGEAVHTLDVVLGVRIGGLVIVDHLYNLQEIILAQLLETLCQLIHVHLGGVSLWLWWEGGIAYVLVATLLLLGALLACGAALLDTVLITRNRARLAESSQESRLGVLEGLQQD